MRLDFNVLWIDDQPNAIKSSVERLRRRMRDEGFLLRETLATTLPEALDHLKGDVFTDQIDLVLVDFDLGQGPKGDTALRQIRNRIEYKDIIFYSSKPAADLKTLAHKQGVEGVYCSSRDDLVSTAAGVFEALVKKVLDLDHTRGIVMGASSDIENIVHDILIQLHDGDDPERAARIRAGALELIGEKLEKMQESAATATAETPIAKIMGLYDLLTASDKLRMLIRELRKVASAKAHRTMLVEYNKAVVPKRNLLAHVRMHIGKEGVRILRARDGRELTQEQLKELRRALLDHRANFLELFEVLGIAAK